MENNITKTDAEITSMSRDKLKNIVDRKVTSHAVKYLNELAEPHSNLTLLLMIHLKGNHTLLTGGSQKRMSIVQLLFALWKRMTNCKVNLKKPCVKVYCGKW